MLNLFKRVFRFIVPVSSRTFNVRMNQMHVHVNELYDKIKAETKLLYNNDGERIVSKPYVSFFKREDFKQCFFRLIDGLDDESREQIITILSRIERIHSTSGALELWTQEEIDALKSLTVEISNVFRVSEDCYCLGKYLLPINHFDPSVFYDNYGIRYIQNIEAIQDKCIIDVGAFVGDSLLILSKLTQNKVYAFEAMSENYNQMKKTLQMNNVTNAVPINKALGNASGKTILTFAGAGSQSVPPSIFNPKEQEEVEVITLDDFVKEHNLDVGLIKVDIEGAEQDFLKGAKQTICQQKPILLLSIYHKPEDFFFIKPEIESWNLDYIFKIHKPINESVSSEVLLIAQLRSDC